MRISGPSEAVKGDELNFECSTSNSNPPVEVWWVVDGRAVQVGGIRITGRINPYILLGQLNLKRNLY